MPCTSPFDAWPAPPGAADRRPVFSPSRSYAGARAFSLPCGRCDACKLARSKTWATRIHHEASMHESSVFLTPTYSDEHLPSDLSVSVRTHQLFIKRCRNELGPLRFFGCGEYGGKRQRPHYHTILFGVDFPDKRPWSQGNGGEVLYRSAKLEELWPFGQILIGNVTFASAAYVARYVLKKAHGDAKGEQYRRWSVDASTGELRSWFVRPEFVVMSRRPGLGSPWFDRFSSDAFPSDFVVVDGRKLPVPGFYKSRLSDAEALRVDAKRKLSVLDAAEEQRDPRLLTKHELNRLRSLRLKRDLEEES